LTRCDTFAVPDPATIFDGSISPFITTWWLIPVAGNETVRPLRMSFMMTDTKTTKRRLRSQDWFDNRDHVDMAAIYLERFMNYGITPEELRSGKPVIGIAQSGSDLTPCNRHHVDLARRVRDGIRDAGGIPIEFPHPSDLRKLQAADRGA
jgi:hypothetical protein